jgi:hypothetical protein
MVDSTSPNLQGANAAYNNIVSKLNDTKASALSNLQADASAASSALSSKLADVNTELRSLVPEPFDIPNVNLQAQLQSLSGLTNPLQSANLLADITSSFGDALTASGFDLDSLVSSAASVFGTDTSLSGLIPNFEVLPSGDVIQKAAASLLPSIGPVTEEAATFVSNTNFTDAKTAATNAVLSTSDALPTVDSGAYKIATKSKKVTQSNGGLTISQEVTTPKDAVDEDGKRNTISSNGFTNSVGTITETFRREDAERVGKEGNTQYVIYKLKHKVLKVEHVLAFTTLDLDIQFIGENRGRSLATGQVREGGSWFKLVTLGTNRKLRKQGKLTEYTTRDEYRVQDGQTVGKEPKVAVLEFYIPKYDVVKIVYKYADTYDPTYAKA